MAGLVGVVKNKSGFASYIIKEWKPWMTEAVLLHAGGMSIPELRVRFGKTDRHLGNIFRTKEAAEIVKKIHENSSKHLQLETPAKVAAIKERALDNMLELVSDDSLKAESPFAFWDASRKTVETISRMNIPSSAPSSPPQSTQIGTVNIQNNISSTPNPEALKNLRSAPSLKLVEVTENVEYLGPPPAAGEIEGAVHGRGISGTKSEGEDGSSLPAGGSTDSSNRGDGRFPF